MLRALKTAARRILPAAWLAPVVAIRERQHSHRLNETWKVRDLSERLFASIGRKVVAGPFAGLVLPSDAVREHVGPYLLGVYEHELHATWAALSARRFSQVVNVGSKFGYYAAGFAKLFGVPVVAYDIDPWARRLTRETADASGVGSLVSVDSACTRAKLAALQPRSLLVIDCDGCEMHLLAPPLPTAVRDAVIVVEVHEMVQDGAGHLLRNWLEATHDVAEVPSQEATPASSGELPGFSDEDRRLATKEIRPHQSWLVCTPKG